VPQNLGVLVGDAAVPRNAEQAFRKALEVHTRKAGAMRTRIKSPPAPWPGRWCAMPEGRRARRPGRGIRTPRC
jgi:hypothetical protein